METTPAISEVTVLQCEHCLRCFDPVSREIVPFPGLRVLPEMIICGLEDCGQVAAERGEIDQRREEARRLRRNARRSSQSTSMTDAAKLLSRKPVIDRRCPADTETAAVTTLEHKEQVKAFASSGNAAAQNELMLDLLRRSFDENQPDQPGQWVSNAVFMAAGIGRPNCRASDLRGTELNAPHAFIHFYGLDVDCSRIENPSGNDKEYYAYRLCPKSMSERLKRKAEAKRDENQKELE